MGPVGWTINVYCEFVGTGGTFACVSRYLKEQNPGIGCYLASTDLWEDLEVDLGPV